MKLFKFLKRNKECTPQPSPDSNFPPLRGEYRRDTKLSPFGGEYRRKAGREGNNAGALLAAKPRKTLLTILAAALCCLCLAVTGLGLSFLNASAVSESGTGTAIVLEKNGTLYKNGLKALYRQLGGSSVTTYSSLLSKVNGNTVTIPSYTSINALSNANIRYNNPNGYYNVQVTFGGYNWLVAFVSKVDRTTDGTSPAQGHLIATLVASSAIGETKYFSSGYTGGNTKNYPANMYDNSYIRSYLVGSKYTTSYDTAPSYNVSSPVMKTFIDTYKDYIVQPKYVRYQETENAKVDSSYSNTANCSYGKSPGGTTSYASGYNYTSKPLYGSWKEDYVWLPSSSEVGGYKNPDDDGIWKVSSGFRSYVGTWWTRSIRENSSTNHNRIIQANGNYLGDGPQSAYRYARAAFHLDLSALDTRTSNISNAPSAKPSWYYSTGSSMTTTNNGGYSIYYASSDTVYASYTGDWQYAHINQPSLTSTDYTKAYGYADSAYSLGNTVTASDDTAYSYLWSSAVNQSSSYDYRHRYSVSPNSGYFWTDGTNTTQNFYLKMYRAVLNLELNSTKLSYDGTAKTPTINSITASAAAASHVSSSLSAGNPCLPTASDFTITYYGTLANGTTWRSATNANIIKPTEVGSYYMRVTLNNSSDGKTRATYWKSFFRNNFTLNEDYADPSTGWSSVNSVTSSVYQRDYAFEITYGDITTYSATAASLTYNGTAQSLITAYSATTNTAQTWYFSTTSSTSGFGSAGVVSKGTNAGTYTVWCKVTAPYYNDRVFSRSVTINKKSIASGVTWSTISDYTYSPGVERKPTPTVTAITANSVTTNVTSSYSTDFEYTYSNNVNAGTNTASVTIKAKDGSTNYTGSTTRSFTINKASVTVPTWSNSQNGAPTKTSETQLTANYTGAQSYGYIWNQQSSTYVNWTMPTGVTFTVYNTDYAYAYYTDANTTAHSMANGLNGGTGYMLTATLKDSSNYKWADASSNSNTGRYLYIRVDKKDISDGVTWSAIDDLTYTGLNITSPKPTITKVGSNSVTTTTSLFTYTYKDNLNAGTATVTVTANSTNYTGTAERTFTIKRAVISVVWNPSGSGTASYTYNGTAQGPTLDNTSSTGATLAVSNIAVYYHGTPNGGGSWGNSSTNTGKPVNAGTYTATARLTSTQSANYTFNSSYASPSTTNSGTTLTKSFNIAKATPEVHGIYLSSESYLYTGEAQYLEYDGELPSGIATAEITYTLSGATVQDPVNVGYYIATLNFTVTEPNNYNAPAGKTATLTIEETGIRDVRFSNLSLIYNGGAQAPHLEEVITYSYVVASARPASIFEISYTHNGTECAMPTAVGEYEIVATLKPEFEKNFGETFDFTVPFSIQKATISHLVWTGEFVYDGNSHQPALTEVVCETSVAASARPVAMFEVTGFDGADFLGNAYLDENAPVNAGNYRVLVKLSDDFTDSFNYCELSGEFVIEKATVKFEWEDEDEFTYDGTEHAPEYKLTMVKPTGLDLPEVDVSGKQIDAGTGYIATATLQDQNNYAFENGTRFFKEFSVSAFEIEIEWSSDPLIYDGTQKTATPSVKTDLPDDGEETGLEIVAWLQSGVKLEDKPVNAGAYTAVANIASKNYVIVEDGVKQLDGSKHNFNIIPRTLSATVESDTQWQYTGVARELQVALSFEDETVETEYHLVYKADGKTVWSENQPVFGKFSAKLVLEDTNLQTDGDFIIPCEVTKRVISDVSWSGDGLSRTVAGDDGEIITYIFDGKAHNITPSAVISPDDEIYYKGEKVTEISLTVKNTDGEIIAGVHTAEAVIEKLDEYFTLDPDSAVAKFEIVRFKAEEVRWYEYGKEYSSEDIETDDCVKGEISYQYTACYGAAGPNLSARALTSFVNDDGETITVTVPLHITYNVSPKGYWSAGSSYEARAEFSDTVNCSFDLTKVDAQIVNGAYKCVKQFAVTDRNMNLDVVTVVWKVYVAGVAVNINDARFKELTDDDLAVGGSCGWLNGVFTFVYDGNAHYPVPTGVNGVALADNCKNKVNVGSYTAYVKPMHQYSIGGDAEIPFQIVPVNLTLEWNEDTSFVYDGAEHHPTVKWLSGTRFGDCNFAYTSATDAGTYACTVSVVDASGKLNKNYKIISAKSCRFTIAKKQILSSLLEWTDGASDKFIFAYDGGVHCPDVKPLTVEIFGADGKKTSVEVPVKISGGASNLGLHYASAFIDDDNFILVDKDGKAINFITRSYEIVQSTIVSVTWEDLSFTYEEGVSNLPTAYGVTSEDKKVALTVWGAQVDAGVYTAYITDTYAFADGIKTFHTFTVLPKTVEVIWTDKYGYEVTESTSKENLVWVYDGTAQSPAVTVGLDESDYFVTKFVNAGSYTAEIVFTNTNYTCAADKTFCNFTIAKKEVEVSWSAIGWSDNTDGVYSWQYNGTKDWKPQYTAGAIAEWSDIHKQNITDYITVLGLVGNVGSYKVVAVLDETLAENFALTNAEKDYTVLPYEVEVKWLANSDEEDEHFGTFVWTYDGTYHAPNAVYTLWDGVPVTVETEDIIGARINAGEYVATIALPANCVFATYKSGDNIGASCGKQAFTVAKKTVNSIIWSGDEKSKTVDGVIVWEYDGTSHCPVATVDGTGAELVVTGARINASGTAYTATAALKDSLNYALGESANATCNFRINEKQVFIVWSGDDKSTVDGRVISWTYSGNLICPTAVLAVVEDGELTSVLVDGNPVKVTVTGGKTSVGNYTATALDTFSNYSFASGAAVTQQFRITELSLDEDFSWIYDEAAIVPEALPEIENGVYTYVFNGTSQRPFATLSGERDIKFAYAFYKVEAVTLAEGDTVKTQVASVTDVGVYEVVITLSDPNCTVIEKSVTVVILPMEVTAVWENTELVENGEVQTPTAYYIDINGQAITLAVEGGIKDADEGTATVEKEQGNYSISNPTCAFTVKKKSSNDYEWDWTETDDNKWKNQAVLPNKDPDEVTE